MAFRDCKDKKLKHCFNRYTVSVLKKEEVWETKQQMNTAHIYIKMGKTVNSVLFYNLNV